MPLALALLGNLNVIIPAIATFITIIRHPDGSATVVTELSAAAAASEEMKKVWADWNAAHPEAKV